MEKFYPVSAAIERANERCKRDNDAYAVYEDNNTGDFIVQTYAARKPCNAVTIHVAWPEEK